MRIGQEGTAFRRFAIPVAAFDYLKAFQREYQAARGEYLNNNECLALILREHQEMAKAMNSTTVNTVEYNNNEQHLGTDQARD